MPAAAAPERRPRRRAALLLAGRRSSCHPDQPRRRVGLHGVYAPPVGPQQVASSESRPARLAVGPRPWAGPPRVVACEPRGSWPSRLDLSPQPKTGTPRVVGCDEPHPSTEPTRPARPALQAAFFARAHCSLLRRCCDVARCSLLHAALLRWLLRRDRALTLQAVFAARAHRSLLRRCCDVARCSLRARCSLLRRARCSLLLAALLRSLLRRDRALTLQAVFAARARCSLLRRCCDIARCSLRARCSLLRSLLRRDRALQEAFAARARCSVLRRCCDVARCSLLLAALLRSLLRRDRARFGHEDPIGHTTRPPRTKASGIDLGATRGVS